MSRVQNLAGVVILVVCSGCATYQTPGRGVSVGSLSDVGIDEALKREPEAKFPVRLAVVRVQGSGYQSYQADSYGTGEYSVVTTRDFETDEHFARLQKLPQVAAVAPLNRMIIPANLQTDRELRLASAKLKTDVLLAYSIDSKFSIGSTDVGPLQLISLGFLPNKMARVRATASCALFDVRSGFVYGVAETTASSEQIANVWSSQAAADASRVRAEKEAFEKLLAEVEKLWPGIVAEHGR